MGKIFSTKPLIEFKYYVNCIMITWIKGDIIDYKYGMTELTEPYLYLDGNFVYKIQINEYFYIGYTTNIYNRLCSHYCTLRKIHTYLHLDKEIPHKILKSYQNIVDVFKIVSKINIEFHILSSHDTEIKAFREEQSLIKLHSDNNLLLNRDKHLKRFQK